MKITEPVEVSESHSVEPIEVAPEATKSTNDIYFFPNGDQPFSVEAASLEEATKANDAYLKTLKKETAEKHD